MNIIEKVKTLTSKQKIGIGVAGAALITAGIIGFFAMSAPANEAQVKEITVESLTGIVDGDYSVTGLQRNDGASRISVEGLTGTSFTQFVKQYVQLHEDANSTEKTVSIYGIQDGKTPTLESTEAYPFYLDAYIDKAVIDFEAETIAFSTFETVASVDASKEIADFKTGTTQTTDGDLVIDFEMTLPSDVTPEAAIAQAKAFNQLFRNANPDKTINSIELHVKTGDTSGFNFHTGFENILERIAIEAL